MQDLTLARYKVIANWPDNSKHKVGDIIKAGEVETPKRYCEWLDTFPHLFKKMEWWEARGINEMPQYIKNLKGVYKAEEWGRFPTVIDDTTAMGVRVKIHSDQPPVDVSDYLPATEEEYNNYRSNPHLFIY